MASKKKRAALPDKQKVHDALARALADSLALMAGLAEDTRKGATHEENRSEGDKDMRATEQSYVARGQAMRAEQLADDAARFATLPVRRFGPDDAVAVGCLVRALVDDEPRVFFLCAQGGGTELHVDGLAITVLTPASPAGRAVLGKHVGDEHEIVVAGKTRLWEIDEIA
ncbi:MAG: GreA/GreB family elongation factor [Sandaracinaceae bacterium]|nr:GreA/GreB family elongation factor [Sandaracinaceae bacterium]